MVSRDVYLAPVLNNTPRLLGLLNRNISSSTFGSFDREFWHYNTVDFSCARKQEAVLTLTLLYLIDHEENLYFNSDEILGYIKAALGFWTKIQNSNGSFNEWYPNENSFVVTSFSAYAVSESLLLIKNKLEENEYETVINALKKAGDWLINRYETRVMNQQTGAAVALLNIYLLTEEDKYLSSSRDKISLLKQKQSGEGWLLEYGGPDIGYLSLAIDYLCKYYFKSKDNSVKDILDRSLNFIKYFIQPNLVAGGEYTSRNTEYLIPHGFEIYSRISDDALFAASVVRKALSQTATFPNLFDDRYLAYVGYTWLQAYMDANPEVEDTVDDKINGHFDFPFTKYFKEAGLLIINDEHRYLNINVNKGGSFRMFDKRNKRMYSDSGILVNCGSRWYTSGWMAGTRNDMDNGSIKISGNMWKVPDKALGPVSNILLRLFQITFGRLSVISLWIKERLRNLLITETKPSGISYNRVISFKSDAGELEIRDSVFSDKADIASIAVFAKDTHIYVPSSRYYVGNKEPHFLKVFPMPVDTARIYWKVGGDSGKEFRVKN